MQLITFSLSLCFSKINNYYDLAVWTVLLCYLNCWLSSGACMSTLIILKGYFFNDSAMVYFRCLCLSSFFSISLDINVVNAINFIWFTIFQPDVAQMRDVEILEDISNLEEKHKEQVLS